METFEIITFFVSVSRSLNRTMQYGNIQMKKITMEKFKSLNRTMQYGNLGRYKVEVMTDARFKSYYVVWKQHKMKGNEYGQTV